MNLNNLMISAKRFITNKNTVTIIGVLVVLFILYWGYKTTIDNAVKPVRVPVAARMIPPMTEVTASDIAWKSVPGITKDNNVLMDEGQIIGKYTAVNATIPANSMFYNEVLVKAEQLPGNWLSKLKQDVNGETDKPYYLGVNIVTTFANSILPDTYVDIYMRARDESGLMMIGKLVENLQILAVKDGAGNDVFQSADEVGTPAYLFFGVPEDYHLLMRKAVALSGIGVELIVVPHGGINPLAGEINITSAYLRDYIEANSAGVPTDDEYIHIIEESTGSNSNETE